MDIKQLLHTVISTDTLAHGSGEDIVGEICDSMYGVPRTQLWESFELLPRVLQDVMLMIELDTELNMNGILGFLENRSGRYLQETVEALQRIGAERDHELLESIRVHWLRDEQEQGLELKSSGTEITLQVHSITSFQDRHGIDIEFIADIAQQLYVYTDRELFVYLYDYVEAHKNELI